MILKFNDYLIANHALVMLLEKLVFWKLDLAGW